MTCPPFASHLERNDSSGRWKLQIVIIGATITTTSPTMISVATQALPGNGSGRLGLIGVIGAKKAVIRKVASIQVTIRNRAS